MTQALPEWPDYYESDTPPKSAVSASGSSYRLVDNNPPIREDFRSTYEEFPERKYPSISDFICACGTSHYSELEEIIKKKNLFPKLRSKKVAQGNLNSTLGMMLDTFEAKHYTIWYRITAQPQAFFKVLELI